MNIKHESVSVDHGFNLELASPA